MVSAAKERNLYRHYEILREDKIGEIEQKTREENLKKRM